MLQVQSASSLPLAGMTAIPADKTTPKTILVSIKNHAVKAFKGVVLHPDTPLWLGNLGTIARSVEQLVKPYFTLANKTHQLLEGTQLTALYNAPFDLIETASGIRKTINASTKEERLDEGLELITNFGNLADDVGAVSGGLQGLKIVSSSLNWLTPLAIFSAAASAVNYIIDGKSIYHCTKLLKKIDGKYKNNPEGLIEKHGYHLGKQGNVSIETCSEIIQKMETSDKEKTVKKKLSKAISKKVTYRRISQGLSIVATTISLIATAILLVSAAQVFVLAGAALLIAFSIIAMARRSLNIYNDYKFDNKIDKIKILLS